MGQRTPPLARRKAAVVSGWRHPVASQTLNCRTRPKSPGRPLVLYRRRRALHSEREIAAHPSSGVIVARVTHDLRTMRVSNRRAPSLTLTRRLRGATPSATGLRGRDVATSGSRTNSIGSADTSQCQKNKTRSSVLPSAAIASRNLCSRRNTGTHRSA